MKSLLIALAVVTGTFTFPASAQTPGEQAANEATQFCLKQSSTRTLVQMPPDKPACLALQTGVAVATYLGYIDPQVAAYIATKTTQRDWAIEAIRMACVRGDVLRPVAIGLIKACNCENAAAISAIEHNQNEVIRVLKVRSDRHKNYPGCENAPRR